MCSGPRDLKIVHFQIHFGIFKNSATFLILTNMFHDQRYIRHQIISVTVMKVYC